jgi:hypothetical protein
MPFVRRYAEQNGCSGTYISIWPEATAQAGRRFKYDWRLENGDCSFGDRKVKHLDPDDAAWLLAAGPPGRAVSCLSVIGPNITMRSMSTGLGPQTIHKGWEGHAADAV